jgi:hypothetical protein
MSKVNAGPVLAERAVEAHTPDLYRSDTQAQLINDLTELSDKDLCFFREQGYLAVKQVFTAEQIAAAQQGVQDLIAGGNPAFRGVQQEASARVYEIVCVNGLLILGESPLKHDGKSIECSLPISDGHGPLFGDIL